jgi:hypothetical protein
MSPFGWFVAGHIATGSVGLITFWIPVLSKKGGERHILFGKIFAYALLATGSIAIGISVCTLLQPLATHPDLHDTDLVKGLFGWMMLYLATLTISLAWYGLKCIHNKRNHPANRHWFNVGLQILTILVAGNCAVHGMLIGQPLMMAISLVGFASGATNLWFIATEAPARMAYLKEHVKALVGAGISVYTAFMSVGLARLFPDHAFNPMIWATPIGLGIALIVYHHRRIDGAAMVRAGQGK